jgi:transcriptional regulator with XRE-family HTH domain
MAKHIYTDNRRQLSTKLIEARETANLTQKQVADSGVLSQSELSKIENGQRKVEFLTLLELAELYEQDIAFFVPVKKEKNT